MPTVAEKVAAEQARRQELDRVRRQEEKQNTLDQRLKSLWKLTAADELWQLRTNRPNKLPTVFSKSVAIDIAEQGNMALDYKMYDVALRRYDVALNTTGLKNCVALISNCSIVHLLDGRPEECIRLCNECMRLDPSFVPARLHRARAFRCLNRLQEAASDLESAMRLSPVSGAEIYQELMLLRLQIKDQEHGSEPPADEDALFGTLHIKKAIGGQRLLDAYRAAIVTWHPDLWVHSSAQEQLKADNMFYQCWQAYTTLNEWKRLKDWEQRLEHWRMVHQPPHQRKEWIYKTARTKELEVTCQTEHLVRTVPAYSPLSLETSVQLAALAKAGTASLARVFNAIFEDLQGIHSAWTWQPPQMNSPQEMQKLLALVTTWKNELKAPPSQAPNGFTALPDVLPIPLEDQEQAHHPLVNHDSDAQFTAHDSFQISNGLHASPTGPVPAYVDPPTHIDLYQPTATLNNGTPAISFESAASVPRKSPPATVLGAPSIAPYAVTVASTSGRPY